MKNRGFYLSLILFILLSGCTAKDKSKIVTFEDESFEQKWAIGDLNSELPSDWSAFEFLTFEYNASNTQRFYINLYDAEGLRRLRILPFQGAWVRASIPLLNFQHRNVVGHDMAAIGQRGFPGFGLGFTGSVGTINQIDSLGIVMDAPIGSPTLEIRNVHLSMTAEDSILSPIPLVDEFGQWIPAEWSGKAKTLDDLKAAWDAEDKALQNDRFNVSKYGGYLDTQAKATGFFRVEKIDGKWWFIDPEGHYFFSLGSTGIGPGGSFSRIEGREYIYETFVPEELSRTTGRRGGRGAFYSWNVQRRFGDDYYQKWMDFTVRRMDDWGLNTIANWSDATLGRSQRKAYVATLRGWGIETGVMGLPDVYAPDYAEMVDKAAAGQCSSLKDDPYLLGYFIGNEQPWPNREQELTNAILSGEETPMQNALKEYLADGDTPERHKAFAYETFAKFNRTVSSAIKKYDPNHLNLGIRYGGNPPDDIIKLSATLGFDVFSLNIYGYSTLERLERIASFVDMPVVIGEFHFGTPGRGLSPGLRQTISQEERGQAYRYYVETGAAHPSLVGTHWFQWWDQPSTGRGDGENYNIGMVDVTDRPYKELIDAARETHMRILDIHSGKIPPTDRQAITQ